jgi:hypothetical protein
MSSPTKIYRLYCFDGSSNRLTDALIHAVNDDDAIAKADGLTLGTKCELWEGRRLVAQLDGERRLA